MIINLPVMMIIFYAKAKKKHRKECIYEKFSLIAEKKASDQKDQKKFSLEQISK